MVTERMVTASDRLSEALYDAYCTAYVDHAVPFPALPYHIKGILFELSLRTLVALEAHPATEPGPTWFQLATDLARLHEPIAAPRCEHV